MQASPPMISIAPAQALDTAILLRRLRGRWLLVVLTSVASFAMIAAVVLQLRPRYFADATLLLEERQKRIVSFEQVVAEAPGDLEGLQSEVQVLRSRELALRTVEKLGLEAVPEFNPDLQTQSLIDHVRVTLQTWIANLRSGDAGGGTAGHSSTTAIAVDILLSKLRIDTIGRSRVISIGAMSDDAERAAAIVNTHAALYIEAQRDAKLRVGREAGAFLTAQADQMRVRVQETEAAIERYRSRAGLLQGRGALLVSQELSEASSQLTELRKRREEVDARFIQLQDSRTHNSLPEVVSSLLVSRLREQQAQLQTEAAQAAERLGPRHPQILQLNRALVEIESKIGSEIQRITASLQTDVAAYQAREVALVARVDGLKAQLTRSNEAEVQLRALSREADAARSLLQTLLTRQQEVSAGEALLQSDARIISRADVPRTYVYPRTLLFLAGGLLGSVMLGLTIGVLPRRGKDALRSMEDVGPLLSARPLGLVPALRGTKRPADVLLQDPVSAFAESIRGILTELALRGALPKSVLVTSALSGEGKTSVALALGRLAANTGYRTLLVDCDLRRPSLHTGAGLPRSPGLFEVLQGEATPGQVIQRDPASGLDIVTCGGGNADAARLLVRDELRRGLAAWRRDFDLVIVDSPPTTAVSDGRVLARLCDEVVFVAQWDSTRSSLVQAELAQLRDLGAQIAGVALTKVNLRRHAREGFAHSGGYGTYGQTYRHG